ncbi:MAG TPA: PAS domain-containing protein [Panacibacter sp.]|nr:PAS domain-containing protein [Panacibacter sp.]
MQIETFDRVPIMIAEEPPSAHWNWHICAGSKSLRSAFKSMLLGEDSNPLKGRPHWLSLVFDEDISAAVTHFMNFTASNGKSTFETTLRYRNKIGSVVYILCRGQVSQRDANCQPAAMEGCFFDITSFVTREQELLQQNQQHQLILEGINAGIWTRNLTNGEEWWSEKLYVLLGFQPGEIEASYNNFFNKLLHPEDRQKVFRALKNQLNNRTSYLIDLRLRRKDGSYHWYEACGKAEFDEDGNTLRMVGSIIDRNLKINLQLQLEAKEDFLKATKKIAKVGGWNLDYESGKLFWTDEIYNIYEVPSDFDPDIHKLKSLYTEKSWQILQSAINEAITEKKEYDLELLAISGKGNLKWLRAIGKPLLDSKGNVYGLRGALQDINDQKAKELKLKESLSVIENQNNRLNNFAHIVSHNLGSHAGNIQSILSMIETAESGTEKQELLGYLNKTSEALNKTIGHLNEVVKIHTAVNLPKKTVQFQKVFDSVADILRIKINETQASINCSFSEAPQIEYLPAYLESIMLNLISNAIKYRHPERRPCITVSTFIIGSKTVLRVTDNGIGIDLDKNKDKLFGMYKTFHTNADAAGIGLFITKNQVEAMGGTISAESMPGCGATFLVNF